MSAKIVDTLNVYIAGFHVGELHQLQGGKVSFSYNEKWMNGRIAIPLSLAMPTFRQTYDGKLLEAYLWGLLPDNEQTIAKWAQRFQVSPRNAFALLKHVGQDCAGAVQFIAPDENAVRGEHLEPLSEKQIGERLRELRKDGASTRSYGDTGQFSLAGAQAKTAFHLDPATKQWGVPSGDTPTTHIFKPPMPELKGHTENEHFCMRLAQRLGMEAADSQVLEFDGEKAIVVTRYDRREVDGKIIRIHQEDMCQALGIHPANKYENQGGPGIVKISTEVLAASKDVVGDRQKFMEANVFNWIIGGTDAHAKNYSMLLGAHGEARLAPLYDISSILPHLGEGHVTKDLRDIKLAMKVDKVYPINEVMPRHWERCAQDAKVRAEFTISTIRRQLARIPDLASECAAALRDEGITHDVVDRLVDAISKRVDDLSRIYGKEDA